MRAIFVEGLPGTGKTTTAQAIQRWCGSRQMAASWWLEEDPNHPATPKTLRRTASAPGFAERCLSHWARFVSQKRMSSEILILEGSAFQSTIRFMLESGMARAEILQYVRRFESVVAPLDPRLVYLEPVDARTFLSEFVYKMRGPEWTAKVSNYLASTPCCRDRGWSGPEGMLEFWLLYQNLCEEALAGLGFPVLCLRTGPGRWMHAQMELASWLARSALSVGPAKAC